MFKTPSAALLNGDPVGTNHLDCQHSFESVAMICSSENLVRFISSSPPLGGIRTQNLRRDSAFGEDVSVNCRSQRLESIHSAPCSGGVIL